MVMVCVMDAEQLLFEIVSVTVCVPAVLYIIPVGLSAVEVAGVEPAPNDQK